MMYIEQGVKSVRMDDIARKMHISKRTIYEIFGDKEELLFQAMILYLTGLSAELEEIGNSAPNVLIAVLMVSNHLTQKSDVTWRLRRSISQFYPSVHKRIQDLDSTERHKLFKASLLEAVDLGLIMSNTNIDLFISMIYFITTAIVEIDDGLVIPEGTSREEAFFAAQVTVLRGISTQDGLDAIDKYLAEK